MLPSPSLDFSQSSKYNISWLFLISSCLDWVNCLSKNWMLDYSLHKIINIKVPLGSHVIKNYNLLIQTIFLRESSYCATTLRKWHK